MGNDINVIDKFETTITLLFQFLKTKNLTKAIKN
jgi:hypothetical protein